MASVRNGFRVMMAIPLALALAGPAWAAQRGGHGGGHGGGGHMGGGGFHGGGGFRGGGGHIGGGFRGGAPAMHGGGFRGGAPAVMRGGGFRGGAGGMVGARPGSGGFARPPAMGMARGMATPRSFSQPRMGGGFAGAGQGFRPGTAGLGRGPTIAGGRAPMAGMGRGFAGSPNGLSGRAPMAGMGRGFGGGANGLAGRAPMAGGMGAMGRNPYGIGGRAPINSVGRLAANNPFAAGARPGIGGGARPGMGGGARLGSAAGRVPIGGGRGPIGSGGRGPIGGSGLAAHNPYGMGGRAPIGAAGRAGGLGAAGIGRPGAGITNRGGLALNPTSMNRAVFSNRSVGINRTSNVINSFGGSRNAFFGSRGFGGQSYAGLHQGWLNGRWGGAGNGGFGRGWGGPGWGRGWGGPGWGGRGWGRGLGGRGWGRGLGGFGLGGFGLGGFGLGGFGFWPGFGFGLGSGLGFGLGSSLFGLGGWGLGGWGMGGLGLGGFWPGYGLGFGGLGLGLGLGYGGFGYGGYGGYGYGGYGYDPYYGGYGLTSWTYGPSLYDWGYSTYSNPYWSGLTATTWPSTVVVQPAAYDYSQPINTLAAPPDPGVTSQTITCFDTAREAFKAGNYTQALDLTDQAIRQMPNDAALHEFRALCLFALQRYDDSAAALYAVLTAGPGWDWATLSGLYPSVSVYTQQLRALESYCSQHPTSAPARFVLAYHYLTEGHSLAALQQLKEVAALQPHDGLSPQLARQLEPPSSAAPAGSAMGTGATGSPGSLPAPPPPLQETSTLLPPASSPPSASPTISSTGREGRLEGTWSAQPDKDTTISVTFPDPGHFSWTVTQQGQPRQLQGKLTYGNGILTLAQDQGPAIVGNLTWTDENHFTFKVPGAGPNDPGLTFTKQ